MKTPINLLYYFFFGIVALAFGSMIIGSAFGLTTQEQKYIDLGTLKGQLFEIHSQAELYRAEIEALGQKYDAIDEQVILLEDDLFQQHQ